MAKSINDNAHQHWLVKLVILIIIITAVYLLRQDIKNAITDFGQIPRLSNQLACDTSLLTEQLLNARIANDDEIRLLVSFNEKPTLDVQSFLAEQKITLHLNTWIFDYVVVDSTVSNICYLAEFPGVTKVSLGQAV